MKKTQHIHVHVGSTDCVTIISRKEESDLEAEEGGEDDESTSEKKKQRRKRVRKSRTRISMGPVVLADGESGYHREGEGEGEGEGTLSDLLESEIDEYILTEQEVRYVHVQPYNLRI